MVTQLSGTVRAILGFTLDLIDGPQLHSTEECVAVRGGRGVQGGPPRVLGVQEPLDSPFAAFGPGPASSAPITVLHAKHLRDWFAALLFCFSPFLAKFLFYREEHRLLGSNCIYLKLCQPVRGNR